MRRKLFVGVLFFLLIFTFNQNSLVADKSADKLVKMEKSLEKLLGTDTNWKPTVFKDLRLGMACKEAKKIFKGIKCDTKKQYDFPRVSGKIFGKVKEYRFTFNYGKLQNATIVFGARITDAKRFETALINVAQRKWGKLSPEKLQKKVKVWTNSDYDTVSLSPVTNNWYLKVKMPKRDTGDVIASSLNEEQIRTSLNKLLGTSKSWKATVMNRFNRGNTCNQVLQVYKVMKGCDPAKNWSFGTVTIKNHDLVHALKFSFNQGQLQNVTLIFHRQLDKELFKKVSLVVFEQKWGKLKAEKRSQDILTIYKRNFGIAQRNWLYDHWEIKHDFPKINQ